MVNKIVDEANQVVDKAIEEIKKINKIHSFALKHA
jgi:hypothetical protein